MALAPPDTAKFVDPRARQLWQFQGFIASIFYTGLLVGGEYLLSSTWDAYPFPPPYLALAFGFLLFVLLVFFPRVQYRFYRYEFKDDEIYVYQGVFWRSLITIARVRVQHVDVQSGPVERALGLVKLSVHVAGDFAATAVIEGLEQMEGERLRSALMAGRKPGVGESDDEPTPPPALVPPAAVPWQTDPPQPPKPEPAPPVTPTPNQPEWQPPDRTPVQEPQPDEIRPPAEPDNLPPSDPTPISPDKDEPRS